MTESSPAPLAAPAATRGLQLAPPEADAAVAPAKAGGMVPLDAAALPALDEKVADYVDSIVSLDTKSPDFSAKAADVRTMGDEEIRGAAETSNRLLQMPVRSMSKGGISGTSKVGTTLVELRKTVEDLDPKEASGAKKLLGLIPFGDKLVDYFRKYESAEKHLDAIIKALYDGQDELRKDNAALDAHWGAEKTFDFWKNIDRININ